MSEDISLNNFFANLHIQPPSIIEAIKKAFNEDPTTFDKLTPEIKEKTLTTLNSTEVKSSVTATKRNEMRAKFAELTKSANQDLEPIKIENPKIETFDQTKFQQEMDNFQNNLNADLDKMKQEIVNGNENLQKELVDGREKMKQDFIDGKQDETNQDNQIKPKEDNVQKIDSYSSEKDGDFNEFMAKGKRNPSQNLQKVKNDMKGRRSKK